MFIMYVYIYISGLSHGGFSMFHRHIRPETHHQIMKKNTTVIECQSNEFRFSQGSRPIKSSFINPFDDGYTYRKF